MCPVAGMASPESAPILKIGDLQLNPVEQTVLVGSTPIKLTPLEFGVLYMLMNHAGQILTKDALVSHVWDYADGADASPLKYVIYRLRRKIESDPKHPRYIQTMPGEGYMFDPGTSQTIQMAVNSAVLQSPYSKPTKIRLRIGILVALFVVVTMLGFEIRPQPEQHCVAEVQSTSDEVLLPPVSNPVPCFDTSAEAVEFATGGAVKLDRSATSEEVSRVLREYYDDLGKQ